MIKLITSIVSCLLLSFVGTFVISKYSKENWIMDLSYDHIERQLDINYILLDNYLNLKLEEKFKNYISKLDSKITLKNNLNPCHSVSVKKLFSDRTPIFCKTKIKVDIIVTPIKLRNKKNTIRFNKSFSKALLNLYLINFHIII